MEFFDNNFKSNYGLSHNKIIDHPCYNVSEKVRDILSIAFENSDDAKFHKPIKCIKHKCGGENIIPSQFPLEFQMKCVILCVTKKRFYSIFMVDAQYLRTHAQKRTDEQKLMIQPNGVFFSYINVCQVVG